MQRGCEPRGRGLKKRRTMISQGGEHKRCLNKPCLFEDLVSAVGYPTRHWGLQGETGAEPLESYGSLVT